MRKIKFQFYPDKKGKWRWRLVASNGKIIANSGESYSLKGKAVKTVDNMLFKLKYVQYEKETLG